MRRLERILLFHISDSRGYYSRHLAILHEGSSLGPSSNNGWVVFGAPMEAIGFLVRLAWPFVLVGMAAEQLSSFTDSLGVATNGQAFRHTLLGIGFPYYCMSCSPQGFYLYS